jgi:hypothetical protein
MLQIMETLSSNTSSTAVPSSAQSTVVSYGPDAVVYVHHRKQKQSVKVLSSLLFSTACDPA